MFSVEKSIGKVSTEKHEPLIYTETCANHKNKGHIQRPILCNPTNNKVRISVHNLFLKIYVVKSPNLPPTENIRAVLNGNRTAADVSGVHAASSPTNNAFVSLPCVTCRLLSPTAKMSRV